LSHKVPSAGGRPKSKEKALRAMNDVLKEIWVEFARIARRLKWIKKKVDAEE
jgi:uncharacterized coiled-coil protein SlyX